MNGCGEGEDYVKESFVVDGDRKVGMDLGCGGGFGLKVEGSFVREVKGWGVGGGKGMGCLYKK